MLKWIFIGNIDPFLREKKNATRTGEKDEEKENAKKNCGKAIEFSRLFN